MDFRERLFNLRRQAGLSQEELANLLGLTRQAVQKWEAGTSRPDMDNLTALAGYFHVSLDYLVTGKQSAYSPPPPDDAPAPPQPAPTVIHHYYHEGRHYEYKSKRTLFGLPLVHINIGRRNHWARGIIAIGNIATGFVALGGIAAGLLSLGAVSFGLLLALGAVTLGGVSVGGVAIGLLAWGGIALGWLAMGGVAVGVYAAGGVVAASRVAVGYVASAPLAIGQIADGIKTIHVPMEGLSDAAVSQAHAAITEACSDAPFFVTRFLKFFAWAELR
ncbi:MAG: helix-turn-helix transcriptional regulator [Oscillospiraceae bacterium]|jgi:transcriptional regulator with XRE-family HTH domain|nr:helix-turn-helix transcriptional regulator [Oscillospiraceae bacterium]